MRNLKKKKLIKKEITLVVTRRLEGKGWRWLEKGSQKMQTSNYKVNKYQECNIQNDDYDIAIYQKKYIWSSEWPNTFLIYTVFCLWLASKVDGHLVTLRAFCLWNLIPSLSRWCQNQAESSDTLLGSEICLWLQERLHTYIGIGSKNLL